MMTAEQLKGSILQLAMQGKLVEQRPEEGTGEELLKKIVRCKTDGDKNSSFDDEPPFEIPESWKWVKHNFLFQVSGGSQPPKSKFSADLKPGYVRLYQIRDYGDKPVPVYVDKKLVSKFTQKGDILLARYGGSLGKVFWAEDGAYNVAMAKVIPLFDESLVSKEYIYLYYHTSLYQSVVLSSSRSAQAGFNKTDLNSMFFPLPPLAEQKRIVAKVDELMPFVEQYAAASTKLNTLNATFPEMMKKSILQEAVQGKLVPQDPNDEPASLLLKKIAEEKKRLIKEGKIKKQKPLLEITEDEIPFDIPDSWEWVRLGDLISIKSGEGLTSSNMKEGTIPVYGGNGITGFHNEALVHEETVVIGRVGYYCGSVHVTEPEAWVTDNAFITTYPKECVNREYLVFVLRYLDLGKDNNATAQPVVSGKKIYPKLFPLPPLDEQKRIANKIEELVPLVEELVQ